ncbi:MAG TPA: LapA family protein [Sedimentisphaerales bacterium]|nr:LapA family protein [Sedimentisphaerales bacterium]HRS11340.1 LapA family protein [Sedimentisphaerales bacterium]HRV47912.1 LapA family protein [Sedimentisphaerales bacterium]
MKIEKKDKIKLVVLVVVAVMAIIIFLQNTEMAEARIFFLRVEMSRALLLILTFALGLLTGILVAVNFLRRKTKP